MAQLANHERALRAYERRLRRLEGELEDEWPDWEEVACGGGGTGVGTEEDRAWGDGYLGMRKDSRGDLGGVGGVDGIGGESW